MSANRAVAKETLQSSFKLGLKAAVRLGESRLAYSAMSIYERLKPASLR